MSQVFNSLLITKYIPGLMKQVTFFFLMLLSLGQTAFSQTNITGTVTDSKGEPLIGATVLVENTNRGTITEVDGSFSISASKGEVLVVSYVAYASAKVSIGDQTNYTIVLQEDATTLEQVVVVGYGEQKKINLTGAVETVTFKEGVNQPVTNSAQLLYGRFSGVQLTQSSGNPGADGSSIVIRGIGTFGNSTPLIVIDNIQYDDLAAFNNLAPSDIESITVLKDASASAIYGARGANGVILVTTKRGAQDVFEISYNNYYGQQEATIVPKFLNASDYALLMNEKFRNENGVNFNPRYTAAQIEAINNGSMPDQFANTDWANEVLQRAPIQNHNLSLSGGNASTTYRFSLGYLGQDAIIKSKFRTERYNLSFNINSKLNKWLTLNTVTNTFWRRNEGPTGGQGAFDGDNGIIYSFQRTAPTIPLFYSNGEYGIVDGAYLNANASFQTTNPLRRGYLGNFKNDQINISHRTGLSFRLAENLSFETSGSANVIYSNTSDFNPRATLSDWAGNVVVNSLLNNLNNSTNFNYRLLNENILKYSKKVGAHTFGVLLGHSVSYFRNDGFSGSLGGFPTDNLEEFNAGGVVDPAVSGGAYEEAYQSFFGRLNYDFQGKYLAEFNLRRDGSSKFGPANRYGTFPSASLGWRVSEEPFIKRLDFVSNLKLRASWGLSGNDRIDNYIYAQTYNPGIDYVLGPDVNVVGVALTSLANPNIRWEQTEQYNIGLDLSLFKAKFDLTADYFSRNSTDILYTNFPIPATLGVASLQAQNAASMINRGVELGLNYRDRIGKLRFSVGGNMTKLLENQVTGLGDGGEETITNTDIIRIGEPFRAYYGYQAIGIFQSLAEVAEAPRQFGNANTGAGDIRYADLSGPNGTPDGIVDAFDRVVIGNPNPDMLVNFNGSVELMGFDLNVLLQGVVGVDRLLMGNGNMPMVDDRSNALEFWLNRWTPENPSTSLPRVGGQNNQQVSTFYIQDASYLRLKNLELGYTLPKNLSNRIGIDRLRIFAGAQNLLTFTKLEHFDPEGARGNQSNRNAPLYKTITFGVNVKI